MHLRRSPAPITVRPSTWTDPYGRLAVRCLQTVVIVVMIGGIVTAATTLSLVTIPVLLALIIASALYPLVGWLRRHGVPSVLATTIAFVAVLAVLAGVLWLLVAAVANQWSSLQASAVDGLQQVQDLLHELPVRVTDGQISDAVDGIVDFVTRDIEVQCLPADIPENIPVDITELMLNQSIRVKDLAPDAKWKALADGETMIVHVVMPKAEESAAAADATAAGAPAAAAPAEPEVIKKGKEEKEEKEKK